MGMVEAKAVDTGHPQLLGVRGRGGEHRGKAKVSWVSEKTQKIAEHEGHASHTRQRDPSQDLRPWVGRGR